MNDKIVNIGDLAIARKQRSWAKAREECQHKRLELDDNGDIVKCLACGVHVTAYWALKMLTDYWETASNKLERQVEALKADKSANIHLVAARKVQEVWRSRKVVPACPHCSRGILPEDSLGSTRVSREMELRRRDVERAAKAAS